MTTVPDTFSGLEAHYPGITAYVKDRFVGNECDTDEYRETQPAKALEFLADWARERGVLGGFSTGDIVTLRLASEWLASVVAVFGDVRESWEYSYAGSEALRPVLERVFDGLWEADQHPYNLTPAELIEEFLQDTKEGE